MTIRLFCLTLTILFAAFQIDRLFRFIVIVFIWFIHSFCRWVQVDLNISMEFDCFDYMLSPLNVCGWASWAFDLLCARKCCYSNENPIWNWTRRLFDYNQTENKTKYNTRWDNHAFALADAYYLHFVLLKQVCHHSLFVIIRFTSKKKQNHNQNHRTPPLHSYNRCILAYLLLVKWHIRAFYFALSFISLRETSTRVLCRFSQDSESNKACKKNGWKLNQAKFFLYTSDRARNWIVVFLFAVSFKANGNNSTHHKLFEKKRDRQKHRITCT